ncbi:MAG: PAS domain-containing protein [Anaerolineales bacterium]|nr:PAS domain-containing protein [Anaerolineales bacterium]
MNQYTIFIIVAPISALLTLAVLLYAQVTYPSRETRLLSWLTVSIMGWLIFNSLEVLAPSESGTLLWAKITYVFIATTPLTWLAFALRYAGQERWLAWKRFTALSIVPVLTIAFALTNDWHMFLWRGYHYIPVDGMLAFKIDRGPWFYVYMLYSYSLTLTGAILILTKYIRSVALYQKQSAWLAVGALTPIVANIIYVSNIIPGLQKDYTPISFAIASIAFVFGMLRYRLFDLHPIARDMVVNGLSDAVFVLDAQNRIVDVNPAALNVLSLSQDKVVGQPARVVFAPWKDLMERFADETELRTEIAVGEGETAAYYDLGLSTLRDQANNPIGGRLIVLQEITQLKKTQQALLDSNRMLEAYASAVALDFKEPTQIILGSGKLLMESKYDISEESTGYLIERIISNAEHLKTITNELLLLAQKDEEKFSQITLTTVSLAKVFQAVFEKIKQTHDIQLPQVSLSNLEKVVGHQGWLEEILHIFFAIAIQHASALNTIKLGVETRGNTQIWLEFRGEGITNATSKVQILVAQHMAARMNGQANLEQLGANHWKLWINLKPA